MRIPRQRFGRLSAVVRPLVRRVATVACGALLAGCATQYASHTDKVMPESAEFLGGDGGDTRACTRLGGDPLQALIQNAFDDSPSLAQSWARLRQARAASRAQAGTLLPNLSLSVERTETETESGDTAGSSPGGTGAGGGAGAGAGAAGRGVGADSEQWQASAAASYELDFWGRLASRRQAARLSARAAGADLRTAAVTLASDVATAWGDWVTAAQRVRALERQVEDARALAELQALRFARGQSGALALTQARQEVASLSARLDDARGTLDNTRVRLNLLLGRSPNDGRLPEPPADLPQPDAWPDPGVPSELLDRRPDLRAAWLRLRAADADAAAAAAERWPRLTLSANLIYQAGELDKLFDRAIRQVAAALDWNVFSGGRLAAEQAQAEATALERLYAMEEAWLQALREVQSALDAGDAARERLVDLRDQKEQAEQRLALAKRRYAQGQVDYLEVLSAQQAVNSAALELLGARNARYTQRVNLCRGLAANVAGSLPEPSLMRNDHEESS